MNRAANRQMNNTFNVNDNFFYYFFIIFSFYYFTKENKMSEVSKISSKIDVEA